MAQKRSPFDFGSPHLRPFSKWPRLPVPKRRLTALAIVIAVALAATALVAFRIPPKSGWGYPLYGLHDYAYLPFLGYAWTRFFPYSLIWWVLGTVIGVLGLITFAMRRSAIHRPHAWLCHLSVKAAANSDRLCRLLIVAVDGFGRVGLHAELLEAVTRLEHVEALLEVVETPRRGAPSASRAFRLIRLTRLLGSLRATRRADPASRLWALVLWQQCAIWTEHRYGGIGSTEFAPIVPALTGCRRALAARVGTHSLLADLETLDPSSHDELGPLADTSAQRLSEIRSILQHLEDIGRFSSRTKLPEFPDFEILEPIGVLSVGIALHLALRVGQPELGLAWIETFGALRLAARAAHPKEYARAIGMAESLTREAPRPDQYRLIRELHAQRLKDLRTELAANGMQEAPIGEALRIEGEVQSGLDYASGIDFGSPGVQGKWEEHTSGIRARILHRIRHRPIPFRKRADIVLVAGTCLALVIYVGAAAILISVGQTRQWFNPWTERLLADNRMLVNVRDHLAEAPLLDAVFHPPDGKIYMSQSNGWIHGFSPATGLWKSEEPFTPRDLADPKIRWLTSTPEPSESGEISAETQLWGVSQGGGLVRRRGSRWEVVISDSRFSGIGGKPVEHQDLTSIAISPDENWLVAGTSKEGFGVYDLRARRWMAPNEVGVTTMPAAAAHAIWWRDRFWIGGSEGLASLALGPVQRGFRKLEKLPGAVVNLDTTADALWVLQKKQCANDSHMDCLNLAKVVKPDSDPVVLLDQKNRYGGQSLDDLFFAEEWNGKLVLAGYRGIFSYDPQIRAWKQHFSAAVSAFEPCRDRACFYFAYQSNVGRFSADNLNGSLVPTWHIGGETFTRIAAGNGHAVALTLSGKAFALDENGSTTMVSSAYSGTDPSRFDRAVALGDDVLFLGASGALLHNVSTRSYEQLSNAPPWLRSPSTFLRASDTNLYALVQNGGNYVNRFFEQSRVRNDDFRTGTDGESTIEGPITTSPDGNAQGVRVIDGRGRVVQMVGPSVSNLTGGRNSALDGARILDAAGTSKGLVLSTDKGVVEYFNGNRAFGSPMQTPDNEQAKQIADFNGILTASTEGGRLVSLGMNPSVLIGGGSLAISNEGLSDVFPNGSQVFLAGEGAVQSYSTATRQIDHTWMLDPAGREPVSIRGIIKGLPLTLSGGVARLGADELDREVVSLFADDTTVWLVAGKPGRRYLRSIPIPKARPVRVGDAAKQSATQPAAPTRPAMAFCEFRNPTAGPGVTQVHDARRLPNGLIATTTNQGLRFYSRERGSWYSYDLGPGLGQGDLYAIGDALLVADPAGRPTTVTVAGPPSLPDDSCSTGPVTFKQPPQSLPVLSLAVNERAGRVVIVDSSGTVSELTGGGLNPILQPPNEGPKAEEIVRSWYFADVAPQIVWVATRDQVWLYSLDAGQWSRLDFDVESLGALNSDLTVDLQPSQAGISIVARHSSGDLFSGQYEVRDGTKRIVLRRAFRAGDEFFGARGEDILDVQQVGGSWLFILKNTIREFDPRVRTWRTMATIGNGDQVLSHGRGGDVPVLVGRSAAGRTVWWVRRGFTYDRYELQPGEVTGIGTAGRVYRLESAGVLRACEPDRNPGQPWNCSDAAAPLELNPSLVRQAFVLPAGGPNATDLILFDTGSGLTAYSVVRGREVPLSPDARTFNGIDSARWLQGRLWLRSGSRLLIAEALGGEINTQVETGVQELTADEHQNVFVRFASGWRIWNPPAGDSGGGLLPVASRARFRVFAIDGATATALDDAGMPYSLKESGSWEQGAYPLPQTIDRTQIRTLIHGLVGDWWVAWGNSLGHVELGNCGVDTPPDGLAGCPKMQYVWRLPDPSKIVVRASLATVAIELTTADGVILRARPNSEIQVSQTAPPPVSGLLPNRFDDFKPWFKTASSGRQVFDPVTTLKETARGLVAVRPSGDEPLGSGGDGGLAPKTYPPLDAEWLRWDRGAQAFVLRTSAGEHSYPKQDFARNGRLLFEGVEALRCFDQSRCQEANAGGVWEFGTWKDGLASRQVQFTPISWTLPVETLSGRFRSGNNDYVVTGGQVDRRPASESFQAGAVTFFRHVRRGLLAVIQTTDGRSLSAYRNGRFLWDTGRRGVALDKAGLLLWSDAGVHIRSSMESFDAGPAGAPSAQDRMSSGPDGRGRLFRAGNWYERLAAGAWQPVVPGSDSAQFEENGWRWVRRNGAVSVSSVDGNSMQIAVSPDIGFGFRPDALSDAASYGRNLFLVTAATLEIRKSAGAGPPWAYVATLPAPPTDRLETVRVPTGDVERLYRTSHGTVTEWNPKTKSFERTDRNPYAERTLAESGRLRFLWSRGSVRKEFRVENARGESHWAAFSFVNGRFPFDVVQSMASWEGELYLGTPAGLQVLSGGLGLDSVKRTFDMGDAGTAPVVRIGRPCDAPDTLVAASTARCFQVSKDGKFQACARPDPLACQALVKTQFWTWTSGDAGVLGRYEMHNETGGTDAENPDIDLRGGCLPHDRIGQISVFDGVTFTVWAGNRVSVHTFRQVDVTSGVTNFAFGGDVRLVPIVDPIPLPLATEGEVPRGMYLQEGGRVWRYTDTWTRIQDSEQLAAVLNFAKEPVVLQRNRLRLTGGAGKGFAFDMRIPGRGWKPIPWIAPGRLSIDAWQNLAFGPDALWAAIPEGLVSFQNDGRLDPDHFRFVTGVPEEAGHPLTDLEIQPGGVRLRYSASSARVYGGPLDDRSAATPFARLPDADPFAQRDMKTSGAWWHWRQTGRVDGSLGRLQGTLKGEPVRLAGGRFDFDAFSSMALTGGKLNLATETRGWFQTPQTSAALGGMERPPSSPIDVMDVTEVRSTRGGQPSLCLTDRNGGGVVRILAGGKVERTQGCLVELGEGGFWRYQYRSEVSAVSIVPRKIAARAAERKLMGGRFTDDVVIGVPVAGSTAGSGTWLPTVAGVVRLGPGLAPTDLYGPPFQGKPEPPGVLHVSAEGIPMFAMDGALLRLDEQQGRGYPWDIKLPPGASLNRIERSGRLILLDWTAENGRHHDLIDPLNSAARLTDNLMIDIRGLPQFSWRRAQNVTLDPWLSIEVHREAVQVKNGGRALAVDLDKPVDLLEGIRWGERLYLIGRQDLVELNLGQMATRSIGQ